MLCPINTYTNEHDLVAAVRAVAAAQGVDLRTSIREGPDGPVTALTHAGRTLRIQLHQYAPASRDMWESWARDFLAHCVLNHSMKLAA